MSPAVKQVVATTIVGILALLALISFFAQLHSSENYAKIFGAAAFVAGAIFFALGWVKRRD
ncbi:hypothetical protein [Streptomyces sp. NPDC056683]|uniref:hypothetical protein n=1 Tax=unclassified Streptomyces TaxID=2593676 RepID=UPI0036C9CF3B